MEHGSKQNSLEQNTELAGDGGYKGEGRECPTIFLPEAKQVEVMPPVHSDADVSANVIYNASKRLEHGDCACIPFKLFLESLDLQGRGHQPSGTKGRLLTMPHAFGMHAIWFAFFR